MATPRFEALFACIRSDQMTSKQVMLEFEYVLFAKWYKKKLRKIQGGGCKIVKPDREDT